ncbi:MAG TPA: hypothetical protein PLG59_05525 [bacterium]|nr:hypothetical protein [bacterium]
MRPIVVIPTLLVVLALGLTGQYVFSQKGGVSIQTQLEQMSNMSF